MANTTASTLINRALDHVSRAATGTTRSGSTMETEAIYQLNTAMRRISRYYDFREMKKLYDGATIDGSKIYTFPTDWKVIIDIRLINDSQSIKLRRKLSSTQDKWFPYPEGDSEDQPSFYAPWGNDFEVYPIPDAAYTMRMRTVQWPTTITVGTDIIDYEPNKDDVILAFMVSGLFAYLQMYTDSTEWGSKAKVALLEAMKLERRQPDWNPKGIGFMSAERLYGDYYNNPFVYYNP